MRARSRGSRYYYNEVARDENNTSSVSTHAGARCSGTLLLRRVFCSVARRGALAAIRGFFGAHSLLLDGEIGKGLAFLIALHARFWSTKFDGLLGEGWVKYVLWCWNVRFLQYFMDVVYVLEMFLIVQAVSLFFVCFAMRTWKRLYNVYECILFDKGLSVFHCFCKLWNIYILNEFVKHPSAVEIYRIWRI